METTSLPEMQSPGSGHPQGLARERRSWPSDARSAAYSLQRELDSWCRERGLATSLNSWVAEVAVRQVWGVDA
jgi:hypothetical protein